MPAYGMERSYEMNFARKAVVMSQQNINPVIESVVGRMGLTPRQSEIACHIAMGLGLAEVASTLFISPATVRTHLRDIFRTVDVGARAELVSKILLNVLPPVVSQPTNGEDCSAAESDPQSSNETPRVLEAPRIVVAACPSAVSTTSEHGAHAPTGRDRNHGYALAPARGRP